MNLIKLIDQELEKKSLTRRASIAHYPSSASIIGPIDGTVTGDCLRKQYYKFKHPELTESVPIGNIWKMELGNSAHSAVADILSKAGLQVKTEVSGEATIPGLKLPIRYRMDNVIIFEDGHSEGLEIKTTYSYSTEYIRKSNRPKLEHHLQANIYCVLNNFSKFHIVYIDRGSGERYAFEIKPDQNMFTNTVSRWNTLEEYLDKNELPPRDFNLFINPKTGTMMKEKTVKKVTTKSDWQCLYCSFKKSCWNLR